MRFPIAFAYVGYGFVFFLLVHGRYERVIFVFQGTIQKSIVQIMRVNCTQIDSLGLYLDFCSALACV